MSRYERWSALLGLLADSGHLSVTQAAQSLAVSEATIRRDFEELAQQRLLARTHGGAVASNQVSYDLPLMYKTARNAPEKQLIGRAAADLVPPEATVALNGGTTTLEVARALVDKDLTVVTNALSIASELAVRPRIKLVLTGGVARPASYELVGPLATYVLDDLAFDWAILGVDGLDAEAGATAHHEDEASINRLMTQRAGRVAIVADSSKLGTRAFARVCGTDKIDVVVTDADAGHPAAAALAGHGVRVITAR